LSALRKKAVQTTSIDPDCGLSAVWLKSWSISSNFALSVFDWNALMTSVCVRISSNRFALCAVATAGLTAAVSSVENCSLSALTASNPLSHCARAKWQTAIAFRRTTDVP
jgi:hypothetical protein